MPKILVIEEIWETYFGIRLRFSMKNPKNVWKYNIYIFQQKNEEKKKNTMCLDLDAIVLNRKKKGSVWGNKEGFCMKKFFFFWFFELT